MKKNLLVTLADKNYISQAKQLFSSVYFNAGFKGDYMLLSHNIAEKDLEWFKDKGILIKECKPIHNEIIGDFTSPTFSKFYLFTPEFKKWDNIIFLDPDIIVRASLDELVKVKGFAAVLDVDDNKLQKQFINADDKIFSKLKLDYDLNKASFNAGVLAFSTDIINNDDFLQLKNMVMQYKKITRFGDQTALNLFFYKKWKPLSPIYNIYLNPLFTVDYIKQQQSNWVILHFIGNNFDNSPWNPNNYFYSEWKDNLDKADSIDLKKFRLQKTKYLITSADYFVGQIGIFLKNNFPKLYFSLKKLKFK